ncbi:MAG: response regulator [Bdellovibrionales bacterium]
MSVPFVHLQSNVVRDVPEYIPEDLRRKARPETHLESSEIRLLIIEDQPSDVALACEMLEESMPDYSWDVVSVARMDDAITLLASSRFDLALVDLSLGDTEGTQIIDVLCMAVPSLPLVVYTGSSNDMILAETLRCGAASYIQKSSMTPQTMRAVLLSALCKMSNDKL